MALRVMIFTAAAGAFLEHIIIECVQRSPNLEHGEFGGVTMLLIGRMPPV
jgi:hypothetical protein